MLPQHVQRQHQPNSVATQDLTLSLQIASDGARNSISKSKWSRQQNTNLSFPRIAKKQERSCIQTKVVGDEYVVIHSTVQ